MIIEVNNGRKVEVELTESKLIFTHLDSQGKPDRRDALSPDEIISVMNWVIYQRENGNHGLMF